MCLEITINDISDKIENNEGFEELFSHGKESNQDILVPKSYNKDCTNGVDLKPDEDMKSLSDKCAN